MEQTGRPPKMYVGVEKAPRIPIWVRNIYFPSLCSFLNVNYSNIGHPSESGYLVQSCPKKKDGVDVNKYFKKLEKK